MLAEDTEEYQCEVSTTIPDLESLELISSDALHLYSASKAKPNGKTRGLVNSPGLLCMNCSRSRSHPPCIAHYSYNAIARAVPTSFQHLLRHLGPSPWRSVWFPLFSTQPKVRGAMSGVILTIILHSLAPCSSCHTQPTKPKPKINLVIILWPGLDPIPPASTIGFFKVPIPSLLLTISSRHTYVVKSLPGLQVTSLAFILQTSFIPVHSTCSSSIPSSSQATWPLSPLSHPDCIGWDDQCGSYGQIQGVLLKSSYLLWMPHANWNFWSFLPFLNSVSLFTYQCCPGLHPCPILFSLYRPFWRDLIPT